MSRVVHFEFSADDPERAKTFFEGVFGWTFQEYEGPMEYWLVSTAGAGEEGAAGIDGGMGKRPEMSESAVNTIGVEDLDTAIGKVTSAGGEIAMPRSAIPGVGWIAYFKDPEGNLWGLYQDDAQAA
jgi:predicted enzyme related to lactoylglutathione lyase